MICAPVSLILDEAKFQKRIAAQCHQRSADLPLQMTMQNRSQEATICCSLVAWRAAEEPERPSDPALVCTDYRGACWHVAQSSDNLCGIEMGARFCTFSAA
jgi:hypothetical protein